MMRRVDDPGPGCFLAVCYVLVGVGAVMVVGAAVLMVVI